MHSLLFLIAILPSVCRCASVQRQRGSWPEYVRGKGQYVWATKESQRQDGLNFAGCNKRLRRAMAKAVAGQPLRITAIGGSNTVGWNQVDGLPWPEYVFNYMADEYGPNVTGFNGAIGGTRTGYWSVCYGRHMPLDSDIILIEFSVNDGQGKITEEVQRAEERLIRKLLSFPNKPAVLVVNTLTWHKDGVENWFRNAESSFNQFSQYYKLPSLSIKSCCFLDLLANTPGFHTTPRRGSSQLKGISFYGKDATHVDGITGARVLAELVMHLLERTAQGLEARPLSADELAAEDLPPPLYPGNYESSLDRCYVGDQFQSIVTKNVKFDWQDEPKANLSRAGWIATEPGALLELTLDTRAAGLPPDTNVTVYLSHLRSYEQMGAANVKCMSGCACKPSMLQGHTDERHSQGYMHHFQVTQAKTCVIQIIVRKESLSGHHKAKIIGLMVSELGTADSTAQWGRGHELDPEHKGQRIVGR